MSKLITLENLAEFLAKGDAHWLVRGDFDGTTGVGYADVANNLTPYSDDSGALQYKPFISQGTGTDNNTAIVTTGNFAQLREKQGNTLVVAQLVNTSHLSESKTENGITFTNNGDGSVTANGTATDVAKFALFTGTQVNVGSNGTSYFKFFVAGCPKGGSASTYYCGVTNPSSNPSQYGLYDDGNGKVGTYSYGYSYSLFINEGVTVNNLTVRPILFNIQSWPADVVADLTAHPEHFPWYYNGSLAYNTGSLENANGVKLVCTKRNLFDEEMEVGAINGTTGQNESASNRLRSKNYILVIPNSKLYMKCLGYNTTANGFLLYQYDKDKNFISYSVPYGGTFSVASNCVYIRFCMGTGYGTTYNHDITISLYYTPEEGGEGYGQHYPYEEPKVYDTGNEELLAFDRKLPDGTIERNTGTKTYTSSDVSLTGDSYTNVVYYRVDKPSNYKYFNLQSAGAVIENQGWKHAGPSLGSSWDNAANIGVMFGGYNYGYFVFGFTKGTTLEQAKAKLDGLNIQYELADSAKTTEEGTPFPENVDIDDYGMMYWLDANDNLVGIPQGAKFFYPVNYKGFTDDLYNRTEGDAGNVVIQDELSASETARDAVDAQLKEALGGTLRQLLAVSKTLDFDNTEFVDLGDLKWDYNSTYDRMAASAPNGIKYASANDQPANMLCTLYKTGIASSGGSDVRIACGISALPYLFVYNSGYTDATAFEAAMKGVLLAYEKA